MRPYRSNPSRLTSARTASLPARRQHAAQTLLSHRTPYYIRASGSQSTPSSATATVRTFHLRLRVNVGYRLRALVQPIDKRLYSPAMPCKHFGRNSRSHWRLSVVVFAPRGLFLQTPHGPDACRLARAPLGRIRAQTLPRICGRDTGDTMVHAARAMPLVRQRQKEQKALPGPARR